jgi:peptidoglycan/xylan/chitin deacetylase (PgdA/CDA1 family)
MGLNLIEHQEQWGEGNPHRIKVLMYHRVVNEINTSVAYPSMCISTKEFHNHLSMLERWGFTTITFNDYRLFLRGELDLPKKPVILTFDDAYLDFYKNAFPVLREFGMTAVVFCVAEKKISVSVWDQPHGLPIAPLMNQQQLVELHAAGVEIGSHSLTHAHLPTLPRERAWDEIYRSRMLLEIVLDAPVTSFAFPYGSLDAATKSMVADAGYEIACATYTGPPRFTGDQFEIRRTLIQGDISPLRFALIMLTPYEYLAWMRWNVKRFLFRSRYRRKPGSYAPPVPVLAAEPEQPTGEQQG